MLVRPRPLPKRRPIPQKRRNLRMGFNLNGLVGLNISLAIRAASENLVKQIHNLGRAQTHTFECSFAVEELLVPLVVSLARQLAQQQWRDELNVQVCLTLGRMLLSGIQDLVDVHACCRARLCKRRIRGIITPTASPQRDQRLRKRRLRLATREGYKAASLGRIFSFILAKASHNAPTAAMRILIVLLSNMA